MTKRFRLQLGRYVSKDLMRKLIWGARDREITPDELVGKALAAYLQNDPPVNALKKRIAEREPKPPGRKFLREGEEHLGTRIPRRFISRISSDLKKRNKAIEQANAALPKDQRNRKMSLGDYITAAHEVYQRATPEERDVPIRRTHRFTPQMSFRVLEETRTAIWAQAAQEGIGHGEMVQKLVQVYQNLDPA